MQLSQEPEGTFTTTANPAIAAAIASPAEPVAGANHAKTDYTDQCETFSAAGANAIIDPEGAEDCRQGG